MAIYRGAQVAGVAVAMLPLTGCGGNGSPERSPAPPAPDGGGWSTLPELPQARTELSVAALDGRLPAAGHAVHVRRGE